MNEWMNEWMNISVIIMKQNTTYKLFYPLYKIQNTIKWYIWNNLS